MSERSSEELSVWDELTDEEVRQLATYNAEKSRGVPHDAEWCEQMAYLQRVWDAKQRERLVAEGWTEMPGGSGWLKIPKQLSVVEDWRPADDAWLYAAGMAGAAFAFGYAAGTGNVAGLVLGGVTVAASAAWLRAAWNDRESERETEPETEDTGHG